MIFFISRDGTHANTPLHSPHQDRDSIPGPLVAAELSDTFVLSAAATRFILKYCYDNTKLNMQNSQFTDTNPCLYVNICYQNKQKVIQFTKIF